MQVRRMKKEETCGNMNNCDHKSGELMSCAPLALAYVPMQQAAAPAYEADEALSRGTLFPGLDLPFKNIVNSTMQTDTPMGELMALGFVTHELALYLDTHADDAEAFALYKKFLPLYEEGKRRFVERYGPIDQGDLRYSERFNWLEDPWPWEYDGKAGVN